MVCKAHNPQGALNLREAPPELLRRLRQGSVIKTKCVWSPIDRINDGLRILATRVRGRRLPARRYDVWMANLGPSEALLDAFNAGRIGWREFSKRYRNELREAGSIDKRNRNIKNHGQKFTLRLLQRLTRSQNVTLLCHCGEEKPHCHRYLLEDLLKQKIL